MNIGPDSQSVVIVDYSLSNLLSVKRKIEHFNKNTRISANPKEILAADKIVLPGVGHFQNAMQRLQELGLHYTLNEAVLEKRIPILGICLGMQLMSKRSEEGDTEGLGWIDAEVVKFRVADKLKYKVPHTGWNQIEPKKESKLMKGVPDLSEFYFVHSYHMKLKENSPDILHITNYEYPFVSAIEKDNILGVQYHPEKSHESGSVILRNFIELY